MMYSKLKVNSNVYNVKTKTLLFMSPASKFIYNIDDNVDLDVAFEYFIVG